MAQVKKIDALDRLIIEETQGGLPICPDPYAVVAENIGAGAEQVMARVERMLEDGIIRRIGVVPNHYALGYTANGMSVWDVSDELVDEIGARIGALDFVSHCYNRPRHLPDWPYNLFAMVHGKTRQEVEDKVASLASEIGESVQGFQILYSTKILKKTGFRLKPKETSDV